MQIVNLVAQTRDEIVQSYVNEEIYPIVVVSACSLYVPLVTIMEIFVPAEDGSSRHYRPTRVNKKKKEILCQFLLTIVAIFNVHLLIFP